MNRRIAWAAVMALVLARPLFAGPWLKSVTAAQKAAQEKNQLILVDMFAEWCGWCHRFEREVFPSAVFQSATADMVLLRLDTEDRGEGSAFAKRYNISQLPTFLVLAPDLSVAGTIRGYAPPNAFVENLKQTRTKYEGFLQRVKNESKLGKDWVQRLTLAKEFAQRGAYDKSTPRFKQLTVEKGVPASLRDEAYYEMAMGYALQDKFEESLKTVKQLTSLSKKGDSVERARVLAGQVYFQKRDYLAARNEFRQFIEAYPSSQHLSNVKMMLAEVERRLSSGT